MSYMYTTCFGPCWGHLQVYQYKDTYKRKISSKQAAIQGAHFFTNVTHKKLCSYMQDIMLNIYEFGLY